MPLKLKRTKVIGGALAGKVNHNLFAMVAIKELALPPLNTKLKSQVRPTFAGVSIVKMVRYATEATSPFKLTKLPCHCLRVVATL